MVSQGDGEVGLNKMVTEVLDVVTKVYSSVNHLSSVASTGDDHASVTASGKTSLLGSSYMGLKR